MPNNFKNQIIAYDPDRISENRKFRTAVTATAVSKMGKGGFHPNEDRFVLNLGIENEGFGNLHILCVVDGHGGEHACTYVEAYLVQVLREKLTTYPTHMEKACIETFKQLNEDILDDGYIRKKDCSGCCISLVVISGCTAFVCTAGDCRILYISGSDVLFKSELHQASCRKESQRIKASGGFVKDGRVFGLLAPSRGFGDADIRLQHLAQEQGDSLLNHSRESHVALMNDMPLLRMIPSPEPVCTTLLLDPPELVSKEGNDKEVTCSIVLYSDGVGDALKSKKIGKIVGNRLSSKGSGYFDEICRSTLPEGCWKVASGFYSPERDDNINPAAIFILNPGLDFEILEEMKNLESGSIERVAHETGERVSAAALEVVAAAADDPMNLDDITCIICEIRLLPGEKEKKQIYDESIIANQDINMIPMDGHEDSVIKQQQQQNLQQQQHAVVHSSYPLVLNSSVDQQGEGEGTVDKNRQQLRQLNKQSRHHHASNSNLKKNSRNQSNNIVVSTEEEDSDFD